MRESYSRFIQISDFRYLASGRNNFCKVNAEYKSFQIVLNCYFFLQNNILFFSGKVGHIVRQATVAASTQAQASSSTSFCKRTLPEYLMIPQYYMSGVLTLTRKC